MKKLIDYALAFKLLPLNLAYNVISVANSLCTAGIALSDTDSDAIATILFKYEIFTKK